MNFYLAVLPARLHLLSVVSQDEVTPFTLGPLGTFQRQLKYLGFDLEVVLMTKQDLRWTKDQAVDCWPKGTALLASVMFNFDFSSWLFLAYIAFVLSGSTLALVFMSV